MDIDFKKSVAVVSKYNVDPSTKQPISIPVTETQQINTLKNIIQMLGIPKKNKKIQIIDKDMVAVDRIDKIKETYHYYVDYDQGLMHFHPDIAGNSIEYKYEDIGVTLVSANRIFTKQDAKGNVIELLSEIIDLGREAIDVMKTLGGVAIFMKKLEDTVAEGKEVIQGIEDEIQKAKEEVLDVRGNKEILIRSDEWTLNGDIYEKEMIHDLNSENLHVTAKNSDTKEAVIIGYKIIDKTRILLKSDMAENMSIILSASYYHAIIEGDVTQDEIIRARKGEQSLDNKVCKIDTEITTLNEQVDDIFEEITNSRKGEQSLGDKIVKIDTESTKINLGLEEIKTNFKNFITLEELGAKGDGLADDLHAFNKAMELMLNNKINKVTGNGVYAISDTFHISNRNDLMFEIDTLIPTNNFNQNSFLLNVGGKSAGSMANINIRINLLDGKNIANGLDVVSCGSSTFDIKTARNLGIFSQIDNPSNICSDNLFVGNNIRQCGFGFIFRSENTSACEGQMIKYNFIYDCYYAGILLGKGSHYTDIHSMTDFNGKSSIILELSNVEGLNRESVLTVDGESVEIVEIFGNNVYCISKIKKDMANENTKFKKGVSANGKIINDVFTNSNSTHEYLDIINANTRAGFSRNTMILGYCGGIYGDKNSINTDFIINNRSGKNENINLQGVQVFSNSNSVKFIDGRSGKDLLNFDTVERKLKLDDVELIGSRQNNVLPQNATEHPLVSVEGLANGSYTVNIIANERSDFHFYGYLIKNGNELMLKDITKNNLDLIADGTNILKATNGSSLNITLGCFITKIGSY